MNAGDTEGHLLYCLQENEKEPLQTLKELPNLTQEFILVIFILRVPVLVESHHLRTVSGLPEHVPCRSRSQGLKNSPFLWRPGPEGPPCPHWHPEQKHHMAPQPATSKAPPRPCPLPPSTRAQTRLVRVRLPGRAGLQQGLPTGTGHSLRCTSCPEHKPTFKGT